MNTRSFIGVSGIYFIYLPKKSMQNKLLTKPENRCINSVCPQSWSNCLAYELKIINTWTLEHSFPTFQCTRVKWKTIQLLFSSSPPGRARHTKIEGWMTVFTPLMLSLNPRKTHYTELKQAEKWCFRWTLIWRAAIWESIMTWIYREVY